MLRARRNKSMFLAGWPPNSPGSPARLLAGASIQSAPRRFDLNLIRATLWLRSSQRAGGELCVAACRRFNSIWPRDKARSSNVVPSFASLARKICKPWRRRLPSEYQLFCLAPAARPRFQLNNNMNEHVDVVVAVVAVVVAVVVPRSPSELPVCFIRSPSRRRESSIGSPLPYPAPPLWRRRRPPTRGRPTAARLLG